MNLRQDHKETPKELPEFKIGVQATHDFLTLTYLDNVTQFRIQDGQVNGWELDDYLTKCIGRLTGTIELRNKLSGN